MKDLLITCFRFRRSLVVCLLVLTLTAPFSLDAQEDFDRLYENGKMAFDRNDYVKAYSNLFAYWCIMRHEAQRMGLSVNNEFYSEVIEAALYSEARINDMIQRMTRLEQSEEKLRQDLAACTGIASKGSMLTYVPPKPTLRSTPPGR